MSSADQPSAGPSSRGRVKSAVVVAGVALVVACGTVVGLDTTGHLPAGFAGAAAQTPSPTATPTPTGAAAPAVLGPVTGPAAPLDVARLKSLLAARALGPGAGGEVVDATTGEVLFDQDSVRARTPASVAKLATTTAALVTLGPGHRLTTRVVAGSAPGELVLVGAGDARLALAKPRHGAYPPPASLTELADATIQALRAARTSTPTPAATGATAATAPSAATGRTAVTVRVDDSLFSGPAVSPDWPASYVGSGVVSPVSALSVDQGRVSARSTARERDPAIAAGRDFAQLLSARGIAVHGQVSRTTAPAGARALAQVSSPTVAELVEADLATSDNDLAEALLRLVAVGRGQPGTFADGTAAVGDVLTELGVPTDGLHLLDGSGLARGSAIAPTTLAQLLATAAGTAHAELRPVLTSLPVARFSGTLAFRFGTTPTGPGAGLVRAKTGTLTGVSTLAGVTTAGGRTLVFAVMADRVPVGGTLAARDALDRIAAQLAAGPAGR
ncbi:MAG: D-alanyl-D-alanine carboxypeptidase/D-alanyl-D-alanine endopeptidase [Actinomycetes bacterium]